MSEAVIINKIIPIETLKPHPRNYNTHPQEQLGKLKASIIRFGQVRSVVAQAGANGSYLLVAGHGFTEAAKEQGLKELRVDVIPANWTPEQIEGYLLSDNLTANGAIPKNDLLAEILEEQASLGFDLESLGSSREELDALLEQLANEQLEQIEAPNNFKEYDESIETEYSCPKCNYKWSGKPK